MTKGINWRKPTILLTIYDKNLVPYIFDLHIDEVYNIKSQQQSHKKYMKYRVIRAAKTSQNKQ